MQGPQVYEIVLTGASQAGKSTALAYLSQQLQDRGIRVLACPEVSTILLSTGLGDVPLQREKFPERFYQLQCSMLQLQDQLRQHLVGQARLTEETIVIIYDRAEMDILAYAGQEMFHRMLQERGQTVSELRDRYHAVIHLTSVAVDLPELYSRDSNPARWDDADHARLTHDLLLQAWTGTPRLWTVGNDGMLEGKLGRVLEIVLHTLGLPQPLEHEYKFVLENAPDPELLQEMGAVGVDIEQHYLQSSSGEFRLRRRDGGGISTFYHTVKQLLPDGQTAEYEHKISEDEFERLMGDGPSGSKTLTKRRWCFVWSGHYYELDQIGLPSGDLWLLEAEILPGDLQPPVPDWLGPVQDVTGDAQYGSARLAK